MCGCVSDVWVIEIIVNADFGDGGFPWIECRDPAAYRELRMAVAILLIFALYAAIGALFGILFVWRGVNRIDAAANGAPWPFRLLILPGVIALWPMLALRWHRAMRTRDQA
ncbi:MAG TPA: hypothetical protein PKC49_13095 [Phycisphaerae bacterium]|nr:hypothetical protein [Phycisphaerae bacterium]